MTYEEFSNKWAPYVEDGFYGLEFYNAEVVEYLDKEFDKEIIINSSFKFSQIKLKFGMARVYADSNKCDEWEENINRIIKDTV